MTETVVKELLRAFSNELKSEMVQSKTKLIDKYSKLICAEVWDL